MAQGIKEQIVTFAAIETERHFVQVSGEMLGADLVPRSHDAAFQEAESGFNGVRVNVTNGVLLLRVADRLVLLCCNSSFLHGKRVNGVVIRHDDFNILRDVLLDELRQCAALGVGGMEETQIAVTFANSDNGFFVVVGWPIVVIALSVRRIFG